MEATIEQGTVDTQSQDVGTPETPQAAPQPKAAKAPEGGKTLEQKAEIFRKLQRKERENPDVKFSPEELDVYTEMMDKKLPPVKKTKALDVPPPDLEAKEEPPEPEETLEDDPETEADDDAPKLDPAIEAALKEVGAKSIEELPAKLKALKALTGSRDAQAVAALRKQVEPLEKFQKAHNQLWNDAKAGNQGAISFIEKEFGFIPKTGNQNQGFQQQQPAKDVYIDPNKFIDTESAEMVNGAFARSAQIIKELEGRVKGIESEKERVRTESATTQAELRVIDEMVQVAQRLDTLKAIPGLREAITAWKKGTDDSRLEVFTELFEIAQAEGTNLNGAYLIKRGKDADRLIAEAREGGKKEAYGHKPNPSLSGLQGGKGEKQSYQQLSDQQLEEMANDYTKIPADWFDDNGNPVKSKIPRRGWKYFGVSDG